MTANDPARACACTVAGAGPDADAWVRALRGIDGTTVERLPAVTDDALLQNLSLGAADAIVFATQTPDLPRAIKRSVMAGRDVLVATPVALRSRHLAALGELAQRRGRVILFDSGSLADERLTFVRKMTSGPTALWRTRYIRSLRTGIHGAATLDELAMADIATVLSIAGGAPVAVSAVSPAVDDETGASDMAMLTLTFDGGPVARIDVSLAEPWLRQEITIACDGRSLVLDALDARAPLQIQANARHRGPQARGPWSETISEHPVSAVSDRRAQAAALFMTAVRERNIAATNASELAAAARVWETARASILRGGEQLSLTAAARTDAARPLLHLIEGGGHRSDAPLPELTLVVNR